MSHRTITTVIVTTSISTQEISEKLSSGNTVLEIGKTFESHRELTETFKKMGYDIEYDSSEKGVFVAVK